MLCSGLATGTLLIIQQLKAAEAVAANETNTTGVL